jgi:hypothetical protein
MRRPAPEPRTPHALPVEHALRLRVAATRRPARQGGA